jgi:hypothetical protein
LSVLPEEKSRPSSAIVEDLGDNQPKSGIPNSSSIGRSGFDFVHYGSQDIVYETKTKSTKVIGRYVLGDVLGEGTASSRRLKC